MTVDRAALERRWIHSHEETPPTRWSCVRTTTRFPPSRRRMECELRHDSEPERVLRIVSAAPDRLVVAKS